VDKFVEKPSSIVAREYIESENYLWNSGMFLFKASTYLEELNKFRSDIYKVCKASISMMDSDLNFLRLNNEIFMECPSESFDYAVMEKTAVVVVVPSEADWIDIGCWSSIWDISAKDRLGNATVGDVIVHNSKDCYIRSDDQLVVTIGVEDLVIVGTKDVIMVAHRNSVQDVKIIARQLKKDSRTEWESHREVYRPWGKFDSIDFGARYQVKRITVKPGAKLSVQMHHHRSEHWIVVSGSARVTNGDKTFLLSENESTYIPIGVIHALENPGDEKLELIEVQSGSYLGEEDIVRFEDVYGRLTEQPKF